MGEKPDRERLIEALSGGRLAQLAREGEAERCYWEQHEAELKERYPDEWVAVVKGEVITHAPTLRVLDVRLKKAGYTMRQV